MKITVNVLNGENEVKRVENYAIEPFCESQSMAKAE